MTGHVKFVETPEEEKCHEGDIKVEDIQEYSVKCNIGFLQCFHKYRISLEVPDATIQPPMAIGGLDVFGVVLESLCRNETKSSSIATVMLTLGNVKGTQETMLTFQKNNQQYNVIIHANILGLEEGTPYLKSGVKMLEGLPATTLSEDSA